MKLFASVILLSALQTPSHRSLDVGQPKRSRLSWPYKSMCAEVPTPTILLFSPVTAFHVTIHPIGTIAGAAVARPFRVGGHIFFL